MTDGTVLAIALGWLGLAVGSFLNVCIHRLPRGGSLVRPRSGCPHCGSQLRWFDNLPILSYVWLRGRCRRCRARISPRYPIVELVTMGVFLLHYAAWGWDPILVPRLAFACGLIVLFAIDLEHHLLPNVITLPGIVAGLLCSLVFPPGIFDAALGVLLGGGVLWAIGEGYYRLTGQEGMGGGDVKLLAMIGAFLGWRGVPLTLLIGSLSGSVIGLTAMAILGKNRRWEIPFGPFLALGAILTLLFGEQLVTWYFGQLL